MSWAFLRRLRAAQRRLRKARARFQSVPLSANIGNFPLDFQIMNTIEHRLRARVVYTSNIFAIPGLRTFFFLLADLAERFYLLKYALGFILSFIGVKMLLPLIAEGLIMVLGQNSDFAFSNFLQRFINHEFSQAVINISLGVVVSVLVLSIVFSLAFPKKESEADTLK